jgi:hypothetical protein
MQVSQPSALALAVAHLTKAKQSSLCKVLFDLSPKWMSVKIAAFLNKLDIECYFTGCVNKLQPIW